MAARFLSYGAARLGVWFERLIDPVCPRLCLACSALVPAGEGLLHLCRACRGRLAPLPAARCCRRCARPVATGKTTEPICGGCLVRPPRWASLIAVWRYQPPLDAVIRALKFRGLDFLGRELAVAALPRLAGRIPTVDLALPVPSPWLRRLRRGFNPAERIGRPLAAGLGIPFGAVLGRGLVARPQVGRSRRERLAGATEGLRVLRPDQVRGRRLLVIDDVLTTGATATAVTGALLAAGAQSVSVLVAAWRPLPGTVGRRGRGTSATLDRD